MVKRVKEACADLNNAGGLGLWDKDMAEGVEDWMEGSECSEIRLPSWEGMCNDQDDYEDSKDEEDFPSYFSIGSLVSDRIFPSV